MSRMLLVLSSLSLLLLLLLSPLQYTIVTFVKCVFFTAQCNFAHFPSLSRMLCTFIVFVFSVSWNCTVHCIWIHQMKMNVTAAAAAAGVDVAAIACFSQHVPSSFGKHRYKQPIKLIQRILSVCACDSHSLRKILNVLYANTRLTECIASIAKHTASALRRISPSFSFPFFVCVCECADVTLNRSDGRSYYIFFFFRAGLPAGGSFRVTMKWNIEFSSARPNNFHK